MQNYEYHCNENWKFDGQNFIEFHEFYAIFEVVL